MNMIYTNSLKQQKCSLRLVAGFSMVELLVVISIIAVLLSVGAAGLKNLTTTGGVSAGIPVAEAVFSQAQNSARGQVANARVLINADENDPEKYLRHMVVAYELEDEEGATKWITDTRGVYLPKGVYFSQKYSRIDHSGSSGEIEAIDIDVFGGVDDASPNRLLSTSYFFYEFNSQGNVSNPGTSFVIAVGSIAPGQKKPRLKGKGKDFGGFVVWKMGGFSGFRHPDQIGIPSKVRSGSEF